MERALLLAINGLGPLPIDGALAFVSDWGVYALPLALLAHALAARTRDAVAILRSGWLAFLFALFVGENVLKPILRRPRPTADHDLLHALHVLGKVPPATSFAFPSGAATGCAAAAAWIWLKFGPRWGGAAAVLAVLISLCRVYAGIHWPGDVLAGWILGILVAVGLARIERWIDARPA